jgi:hypothetical protein
VGETLPEAGRLGIVTAPWLDRVLAAGAVLDLHHADARAELAAAILAAIPRDQIVTAISASARSVLEEKGVIVRDRLALSAGAVLAGHRVVGEIGRNAAQTVLYVLEEPLV